MTVPTWSLGYSSGAATLGAQTPQSNPGRPNGGKTSSSEAGNKSNIALLLHMAHCTEKYNLGSGPFTGASDYTTYVVSCT